jgi:hypothetical protein
MTAPIEMAWEGKSIGEICRQIKDPNRNGGRDLSLLHEHLAHDDLVAWGWQPGAGRDPAPGSQALLGELIQAERSAPESSLKAAAVKREAEEGWGRAICLQQTPSP